MPSPGEIFTSFTVEFIMKKFDVNQKRILDVGCGDGLIAKSLLDQNADVVALDYDEDSISSAKRNGIHAENIDFLNYQSTDKFDIILFSRSLHHIFDLSVAMTVVNTLLKDSGVIILEEFDYVNMDSATLLWYYSQLSDTIPDVDLAVKWDEEHFHDPPLHTGEEMISAVRSRYRLSYQDRCPYLFRMIGSQRSDDVQGYFQTSKTLDEETELIWKGKIRPLGLRIMATKS